MTLAILAAVALGVASPHVMSLDRARPATATLLWLTSLTLRLLLGVAAVLWILVVLPSTELYRVLTHWCVHAEAHGVGIHFDVQGHAVGQVTQWFPLVALVGALLLVMWRIWRAVRCVGRTIADDALGAGPGGSVIVGGADVLLAATGFARPRVVVSAGALAVLDDDELAAALAHETGHIRRRHHVVLAYAQCCAAVARIIPGTRGAVEELRFHVERDADDWALQRDHDPYALASAICKAATLSGRRDDLAVARLAGGALDRRLDLLSARPSAAPKPLRRRLADSAAVLVSSVAIASAVAIPAEAVGAVDGDVAPHGQHHCVS